MKINKLNRQCFSRNHSKLNRSSVNLFDSSKKLIIGILFFNLLSLPISSQITCDPQAKLLLFCQSDSNTVKLRHQSNTEYNIYSYKFNSVNNSFSNFTHNKEDSTITFKVIDNVPYSGIFGVLSGGFYCWSYYTFGDQFYFMDLCRIYDQEYCDSPFKLNSNHRREYCIGDTTYIRITNTGWSENTSDTTGYVINFADEPGLVNPPDPSRYNIPNAKIIEIKDDFLTLVWDKVGLDCISISTEVRPGCTNTLDYLINVKPKEDFRIEDAQGNVDSTYICVGESVSLQINNNDEFNPRWEVDDGRVFFGYQNDIIFSEPGEYSIWIHDIESADYECSCSPGKSYKVIVEDGDSPAIECSRTICKGDTITYFSSTECNSYIWQIGLGGNVITGGTESDSYVEVIWDGISESEVALTTPDCFETTCRATVVEHVGVIQPTGIITGLEIVCLGDLEIYSLPNYDGTDYTWEVSSNAEILFGQNSNSIQVQWSDLDDNSFVNVTYENCNLGCNGEAFLPVSVIEKFEIVGWTDGLCIDEIYTYSTVPTTNTHWQLKGVNGTFTNYGNGTSVQITLDTPGTYTLIGTDIDNQTCNLIDSIDIVVLPEISDDFTIEGPQFICSDVISIYQIPELTGFETAVWQIFDGSNLPLIDTSRTLHYQWTEIGPSSLEVFIINTLTGCKSKARSFLFDQPASLSGRDVTCIGNEEIYALLDYEKEPSNWNIIPAQAGTILEINKDWCKVIWRQSGQHFVQVEYCGQLLELEVNVTNLPSAQIDFQAIICEGEQTTITINTDNDNTTITRNFENQIVSSERQFLVNKGYYITEITSPEGCITSKDIFIESTPGPTVELNLSPNISACPPFTPFQLSVLNPSSDLVYQWYLNSDLIEPNATSILADNIGTYWTIAIDNLGCRDTSANRTIFECCGLNESSPASNFPVSIDVTHIDCNNKQFEILPPFSSTQFVWNFGDPQSENNSAIGFFVEHEFSSAGFYRVVANGNANCEIFEYTVCGVQTSGSICEQGSELIEIPLVADFEFSAVCGSVPMTFINTSTTTGNIADIQYSWDFDDLLSSPNSSSDISPTHLFSENGIYNVKLVATSPSGCISTANKTVTINSKFNPLIISSEKGCVGAQVAFEAITSGLNLLYKWNFDDPGSGSNNFSQEKSAQHLFSEAGIYTVQLDVFDENGCSESMSTTITIAESDILDGNYSNEPQKKCPGEQVIVNAPFGDFEYYWNTEETTQSITVTDHGSYTVTVTNDFGCEEILDDLLVLDHGLGEAEIVADRYGDLYYDSIHICYGDAIILKASHYHASNMKYKWSTGDHVNGNIGVTYFKSLEVGSHQYSVTITNQETGCSVERGPFKVVVHPEFERPEIISNKEACEGSLVELSTDPYFSNYSYEWSTGETTPSIIANFAGYFTVTVTNEYGCFEQSLTWIRPTPSTNEWMTGCMEVCFPHEFCMDLDSKNDYELILNGQNIGPVNTTDFVEMLEPGEYQILVINKYDCQSLSDILSLDAKPEDHNLSGIVFRDINENGIFDSGDELLENVEVFLMSGNTILATTYTDALGQYAFQSLHNSQTSVVLNLETLPFAYEGNSDSLLIFDHCKEDKIIDFPLNSHCHNPVRIDTFYTCSNIPITILGQEMEANSSDTIRTQIHTNCDSMYVISVLPFLNPEISLTPNAGCPEENNGSIQANTASQTTLQYSLDSLIYQSSGYFQDLTAGEYTLFVYADSIGCSYEYPFTIENNNPPLLSFTTENSCSNENEGILNIEIVQGNNLTFSIDNGVNFTDDASFYDLPIGKHFVEIMDEHGCISIDSFTIDAHPGANLDVTYSNSCQFQNNGLLTLSNGMGEIMYSFDNENFFENDTVFANLEPNNYTILTIDNFNCEDSLVINIVEIPKPTVILNTENPCNNSGNGILTLSTEDASLTYSIDGQNFQENDTFYNLSEGNYDLYYRTLDGCIYTENFDLQSISPPTIKMNITDICPDDSGGILSISNINDVSITLSIDDNEYQTDSQFINITAGAHILTLKKDDCYFNYPFSIHQIPKVDFVITTELPCLNLSNGSLEIVSNNTDFLVSLDGQNFSEELLYTDLSVGSHIVEVMDTNGCLTSQVIDLLQLPPLEVVWNVPDADCSNESVLIAPEIISHHGEISYIWSDNSVESSLLAQQSNTYSVTISDACDEVSFSSNLDIHALDVIQKSDIANIFTPNNDGINDCFSPFLQLEAEIISLEFNIFDRWGNLISTLTDPQECWNGTYQNNDVKPGVYVYMMDVQIMQCNDVKSQRIFGDVTLVR